MQSFPPPSLIGGRVGIGVVHWRILCRSGYGNYSAQSPASLLSALLNVDLQEVRLLDQVFRENLSF